MSARKYDYRYTLADLDAIVERSCLSGFRHGNGYISGTTVRVAREDFDTDPDQETKNAVFDHLVVGANCLGPLVTHVKVLEAKVTLAEQMVEDVELLMQWCVKNVNKWDFPQYDALSRSLDKFKENGHD